MPTDPLNTLPKRGEVFTPDLAQHLELVVREICSSLGPAGTQENAIALVRVFNNSSPEDWNRFASLHGLSEWLCISLKRTLADSVDAFFEAQQRLAFERDHDSLTGLVNRGCFDNLLEVEVGRALRSRADLSLLYIDLDNFKQVNDTYGHYCGDMALIHLAKFLRENVRTYDTIARIGGEEFCVILPSTTCWTAFTLANRLLDIFRKEVILYEKHSLSLTFSGGVSSLFQLEKANRNSTCLMKSADKALYEAKEKKNRIIVVRSEQYDRMRRSMVMAQEKEFLFSPPGLKP